MRADLLRPVLLGPWCLLASAMLFLALASCAVQLAARCGPEPLGTLIDRSADPDPQVRCAAIEQLGRRLEVEVVGALECALADPEAAVRAAAITALPGRPAGVRLLEHAAATDADAGNRRLAAELLAAR